MTNKDKYKSGKENPFKDFMDEFGNFLEITESFIPTLEDIPKMGNMDIHGEIIPLGEGSGGDHIIYLDFAQGTFFQNAFFFFAF